MAVLPTYELLVQPYTSEDATRDNPGHMYSWVKGTSPATPWGDPYGTHTAGKRDLYVIPSTDTGTPTGGASPVDEWWIAGEQKLFSPWIAGAGGFYWNWHSVPATPGSDLTDDGVSPVALAFFNGQSATVIPNVYLPPHYLQLQGNKDNPGGQVGTDLPPYDPVNLPHIYELPTPSFDEWHSILVHIIFGRTDGTTPREGLVQIWMDGVKVLDVSPVNTLRLGHSRWDGSVKPQYIVDFWQGGPYLSWGYKTSDRSGSFQSPPQQTFKVQTVLARFGQGADGLNSCLADPVTHNTSNSDDHGVHVTGYTSWGDSSIALASVQRATSDFVVPSEFNGGGGVTIPANTSVPTITGSPVVGGTLTASPGAWDGPPDSFAYEWRADGTAIAGATGGSFVLTSAQLGDTITVHVTATNTAGNASADSAPTAAVTAAASVPTGFDSVTTDPGCTVTAVTDGLEASIPGGDDTADTAYGVIDFGGSAGVSARTFTRTILLLASGQTLAGNLSVFQVRDVSGNLLYEVYLTPGRAVSLYLPSGGLVGAGGIIESTAVVPNDGTTTATVEVSALTNSSIVVRVNGTDVISESGLAGGTGGAQRYLIAGVDHYDSSLSSDPVTVTHTSVAETTTDWLGGASTIPANTALPVITGVAKRGQPLTASTGTWDNSPTSYAYQWNRAGAAITGATMSTYTLVEADVGSTATVTVTASNAAGDTAATSAATATVTEPVAPNPPVNVTPPALTGVPVQGAVLTCTTGVWTNDPTGGTIIYAYQWETSQNDGDTWDDLAGATSGTLDTTSIGVGALVRCRVTAMDANGATQATTAAVAIVAPAPPNPRVYAGVPRTFTVQFGPAKTGLATVGYHILGIGPDGSGYVDYQARTTSGVHEVVAGTGVYAVDLPESFFTAEFNGIIVWDTGEGAPVYAAETVHAASAAPSRGDYTPDRAAKADNLDVAVSTRSSHAPADVWASPARALTDKTGFELSDPAKEALWNVATAALTTPGGVGALVLQMLDAAVSSRAAGATLATLATAVGAPVQASDSRLGNLDAAVSTRAAQASVDDLATVVGEPAQASDTRLANLDAAISSRADAADWTSARAAHLDADVSSRASAADYTTGRAAKLDQLDATVSSRLATSGYTAPPAPATVAGAVLDEATAGHTTAGTVGEAVAAIAGKAAQTTVDAVKAKTDALPADPTSASVVGAPLQTTDGRLAHLDANVSSRLAATSYQAPPDVTALALEASVQAVKAKTDAIPASPATAAAVSALGSPVQATDSRLDQLDAAVSSRASATDLTPARAAKLDQLDAAVSSRLAAASYEQPPDVSALATQASVNALGSPLQATDARLTHLDANVSSRADGSAYTTLRAAKLDQLDATVSSRATPTDVSGATPDLTTLETDVAAIRAKTDPLPASGFPDASVWTSDRAARIDHLDADISSRASSAAVAGVAAQIDVPPSTLATQDSVDGLDEKVTAVQARVGLIPTVRGA